MKIGYPCINRSIGCTSSGTFRLASYSRAALYQKVSANLLCLEKILQYNVRHNILFFRITSDLVPFASHPVCRAPWRRRFKKEFARIGRLIRRHGIRISMHPDQFTLVNSKDSVIFRRSEKELSYHAQVLDMLGLDRTAKIQIHAGGVYGDKIRSMERFLARYEKLKLSIRRRLVLENDEISYSVSDCLWISRRCGIPVLFDAFHHELHSGGRSLIQALGACIRTWRRKDGLPMSDYSSQQPGARRGAHARSIDRLKFRRYLSLTKDYDFDIMLEIKDKEESALAAVAAASRDARFITVKA